MYNRHWFIATLLFLACFSLSLYKEFNLQSDLIANLITFFSIVFGFYLTALSMLYGSNFTKRLGNEQDPLKSTQTKFHTLIAYFQISSFTSISSIVILLISNLLGLYKEPTKPATQCFDILDYSLCAQDLFIATSLGLAAINIFFMVLLFKIFFNAFIEEGDSNA